MGILLILNNILETTYNILNIYIYIGRISQIDLILKVYLNITQQINQTI